MNKPQTECVFCPACSGPGDCNWEGREEELAPLGDLREDESEDDLDGRGLAGGRCPQCGTIAEYGPPCRRENR